jgi:glucose-6-phosphate 1-dehydrogenase
MRCLAEMDSMEARQQKEKQTYYRLLLDFLAQEVRRFFKRDVEHLGPGLVREINDHDGTIYRERAEAAERAAEATSDAEAKRMFKSAAQRWRKLADILDGI